MVWEGGAARLPPIPNELRSLFEVVVALRAGGESSQGRPLNIDEEFFKRGALRESVAGGQMLEAAPGVHRSLRSSVGCGVSGLDLILGPIAAALDAHGVGMVEQPVQQGGGQHAVVVEDGGPLLVDAIGSECCCCGSVYFTASFSG